MNDSSNIDDLRLDSIELYKTTEPSFYMQMTTGVACLVGSCIIFIVVAMSPSLRRRSFYFLVANLSIADGWLGAAYTYVNARRLVVFNAGTGSLRTERDCLLDIGSMTGGIVGSSLFTLLLCIDRAVALMLPHYYRRQRRWHSQCLMALGWLYVACDLLVLALTIDAPDRLTPMCTNTGIYGKVFNMWSDISTLTYCSLAFLLCAATLMRTVCLIRRPAVTASDNSGGGGGGGAQSELYETTRTIAVIGGLLFVTQVGSRIGYLMLNQLPRYDRARYGNYLRVLQILCAASNLPIYLTRSTLFRREFLALLRSTNLIAPAPNNRDTSMALPPS